MTKIKVAAAATGSNAVTAAHFGANVVYKVNTDHGNVGASFGQSAAALGISHVRYPAGQGDHADASGEGTEWLNVVKMPNGALRRELTDFLDWCGANDARATLVIPTKFLDVAYYDDFAAEIARFAQAIAEEYPGVVAAFEIGNEYWDTMGEGEYAAKVNIALAALNAGMNAADAAPAGRPDLIVQMATPNAGSEFHPSKPGMGEIPFSDRLEMANARIIEGLTLKSKALIDGVVEHYYYARDRVDFTHHSDESTYINRDFEIWEQAFDKELDLHITEWNVKASNMAENGIRSATAILHQFDNMVEMGVDSAAIWAVQHNTPTDLTGNAGDGVITDSGGRVVSTVRGAIFDILSENVVGLNRLELSLDAPLSGGDINAFAGDGRVVVYVSSRSPETESFTLDLGSMTAGLGHVAGLRLGYDPTTADGRHYDPYGTGWEDAHGMDLDGDGQADYFTNEHDVQALFTEFRGKDLRQGSNFSFDLKPYEVMQLVFTDHRQPQELRGGDDDDVIAGTARANVIYGLAGEDRLIGKGGRDDLLGGMGGDRLLGGKGQDRVQGQSGQDVLKGLKGDDFAFGGRGDDRAIGGAGADRLLGGRGADRLEGGAGNDTLFGQKGNDVLVGGAGNDEMTGGGGRDVFVFKGGDDRILDFAEGETIRLARSFLESPDDLAEALASAQVIEDSVVMKFGDGNSLVIVGYSDLDALPEIVFAG